MLKRIFLFLVVLILVITTILTLISLAGMQHYLTSFKINWLILALIIALWGTLGAFLSLLLTKFFMQSILHIKIIHSRHASPEENVLLEKVNTYALAANLKIMPSVGIYQSPELNALSVGPSRDKALLAFSSSLLTNMDSNEQNAVIAHEISTIANGDMITLSLIQGIINAFALFLTSLCVYVIALGLKIFHKENKYSALIYSILTLLFVILFTLLGSIAVAAFSRSRVFRADRGSAHLAGRKKMLAALQRLQNAHELEDDKRSAFTIYKLVARPHWLRIFSTHPPLAKRIQHLG